MGKKAKIRKKRREQMNHSPELETTNPDNFIKQIEKVGYRKEQIQRSPEVPRDDIEPII
ncbi:MAG: hypothetical protein AB4372_36540 [Xenococcus sp. (in: cyanobacteria)]